MQNALAIWAAMDLRRRIIVIGATLGVFLAVLAIGRAATSPDMVLLYAGLEESVAGDVTAALEKRGVQYQVRGGAIYVDQIERDSLRLTLASEGMPGNTGSGYELLDGLTGFGTTSQMFDAAYWRAKEGELARTIAANPMVRQARVHISQAPVSIFAEQDKPSASVSIVSSGGTLPIAQARAIRHLVASAVSGLAPEQVSVIDSVGGLIDGDLMATLPGPSGDDRALAIQRNVERLLAARVGEGRSVVEVSVDLVTERQEITERKIDPQGRVAISSETVSNSGTNSAAGGDVTVASNLPEGNGAGAGNKSENNESRERINYELSETQSTVLREPGAVRRITLAVLVDGVTVTAADGTVTKEPRNETEMAALGELVSSAAGLDTARGDVLTLKSLDLAAPVLPGGTESGPILGVMGPFDLMGALQLAVLAIVALVLVLFVLRPLVTRAGAVAALPPPYGALALPGPDGTPAFGQATDKLALPGMGIPQMGKFGGDLSTPEMGEIYDPEHSQDPIERLRRLIEERQVESVEILRNWIEADPEEA